MPASSGYSSTTSASPASRLTALMPFMQPDLSLYPSPDDAICTPLPLLRRQRYSPALSLYTSNLAAMISPCDDLPLSDYLLNIRASHSSSMAPSTDRKS